MSVAADRKLSTEERLLVNAWDVDPFRPHIRIIEVERCRECSEKPCTLLRPAKCYVRQDDRIVLSTEPCLECGTCRVVCPHGNIDWNYPRSRYG